MFLGPVMVGAFLGYCSALVAGVYHQSWMAGIIVGESVATVATLIAFAMMGYWHPQTDKDYEQE